MRSPPGTREAHSGRAREGPANEGPAGPFKDKTNQYFIELK